MKKEFLKIAGSASGTLLSAFSGVFLVKLISLFQGPAGLGTFGLIRQFFQLSSVLLSLGNGVSIIENTATDDSKNKIFNKILIYFIFVLITFSAFFYLFSSQISNLVFSGYLFSDYLYATPLTFLFIGLFLIIRYTLSGLGFPTLSAFLQSLPFISMAVLYFLMHKYEFGEYFFYLFLGGYFLAFFVSLIIMWIKFKELIFLPRFSSFERDNHFEKISLITFISSGTGFTSFLIVKSLSTNYFNIAKTGLLEAAWSLSSYTGLVFLSGLTLYYLPKLKQERNADFSLRIYLLISNLTFFAMLTVMALKSFIIPILFSKSFLDSREILEFMLIGDYLRSSNWFFMFTFIALNSKKKFFIADMTGNFSLVLFSYLAVEFLGVFEYLGVAYVAYQLVYFLVSLVLLKKLEFLNLKYIYLLTLIHVCLLAAAKLIF